MCLMNALQSNMATAQEYVSHFSCAKFQVLLGDHFSAYRTNSLAHLRRALSMECTLLGEGFCEGRTYLRGTFPGCLVN